MEGGKVYLILQALRGILLVQKRQDPQNVWNYEETTPHKKRIQIQSDKAKSFGELFLFSKDPLLPMQKLSGQSELEKDTNYQR